MTLKKTKTVLKKLLTIYFQAIFSGSNPADGATSSE